jgi:hypothetical protein
MNSKSPENATKSQARADDPAEIILILRTRNQVYLDMVIAALENENIPALVKSVTGYHGRGMLPFEQGFFDYHLYVTGDNQPRAKEIVETIVPLEEIQ